ncbi:hypothetical protein Poli38472_011709 [Pythium oligandrum]|uniref:HTH psq-type domain-containing protein n=1 Tax=Pythium oligandrum TaxID=41045 RepID=A0A8K1C828_PYTOL|nr:hypothetical protein Poli38472_011709 [Pythium oligandrum]|eukprot:TMW58121.1 hypothetical protein Poli38472_011709 [Pythium oligandrum]
MTAMPLPSFQTFLESTRYTLPQMTQHVVSVTREQSLSPMAKYSSKMYQLAVLTAMEYEKTAFVQSSPVAIRRALSPASSYEESNVTTSSDESELSDEERRASTGRRTVMPCRTKKKYLKERQRYEIVRRVRAGEKQAHLAKEFGVSRAAVCYLLKHQLEILSRSGASERM